jgi:hypothetical protein
MRLCKNARAIRVNSKSRPVCYSHWFALFSGEDVYTSCSTHLRYQALLYLLQLLLTLLYCPHNDLLIRQAYYVYNVFSNQNITSTSAPLFLWFIQDTIDTSVLQCFLLVLQLQLECRASAVTFFIFQHPLIYYTLCGLVQSSP